jgi:hypothetical protein
MSTSDDRRSVSGRGPRTAADRSGRQRPDPTSALAPAPAPLMPVPAADAPASGRDGRAGRRQHHRPADPGGGAAGGELVYLSGRVPRALRDELHIRAIGEGRPVVDLLRDAIRAYLDAPGRPAGTA